MAIDIRELREQLVELLRGGSAHADVNSVLADFPTEKRAAKPQGAPYNAWQLLWHIHFTLHDLLDFCTNPKYLAPKWPDDYWPAEHVPPSEDAWDSVARGLQADLAEFQKIIMDPAENMYATIPWGDGQTVLREIFLAADHTSYHLGQIVLLRKQLDSWKS
ncbi:hypothetical protein ACPOL_6677 [Acidisarcina polymorpha]|uniref:DinB-like domain-containing protein n=1 Tax=Acidisarcina polymorpha TaxID=2211140 RepID=A0A2Z5GA35_9BACT|nr:DinB family protein [Acidisarcina polymorpha]AXC15889.1 hypothetical protein ACPOL_6677 [Acidisarcina polymorpha]